MMRTPSLRCCLLPVAVAGLIGCLAPADELGAATGELSTGTTARDPSVDEAATAETATDTACPAPDCASAQAAYDAAVAAAADAQAAEDRARAAHDAARGAADAARAAATRSASSFVSFQNAYLQTHAPGVFTVGSNPNGWSGRSGGVSGSPQDVSIYFDSSNPAAIPTLLALYGTSAYHTMKRDLETAVAAMRDLESRAREAQAALAAAQSASDAADAAVDRARALLEECLRSSIGNHAEQLALIGQTPTVLQPPIECPRVEPICSEEAPIAERDPRSLSDAELEGRIAELEANAASHEAGARRATGDDDADNRSSLQYERIQCELSRLRAEHDRRRAAVAAVLEAVLQKLVTDAWFQSIRQGQQVGALLLALNFAIPLTIGVCAPIVQSVVSTLLLGVGGPMSRVALAMLLHPRLSAFVLETIQDIFGGTPTSTPGGALFELLSLVPFDQLFAELEQGFCAGDLEGIEELKAAMRELHAGGLVPSPAR